MPGLFSNFCGFGGAGIPQHKVDELCREHDNAYQNILDHGGNPYTHWNEADATFLFKLKRIVPDSLREGLVRTAANIVFSVKEQLAPTIAEYGSENEWGSDEETKQDINMESFSNSPSEDTMATGDPGVAQMMRMHHEEYRGSKRKKQEEHGMEPSGHGNTPAGGTSQAHYIEKYVPVGFPTKLVLKLKYTDQVQMRSIGVAGATPNTSFVIYNTNSLTPLKSTSTNALSVNSGGHHLNQSANWIAQYNYYRIENCEYKITCYATANAAVSTTQNPPGTFVSAQQIDDCVVTLGKTMQLTDYNSTSPQAVWEQKSSNNQTLGSVLGGKKNSCVFEGTVNAEDYDVDVSTTAQDETWTVTTGYASPSVGRYMALVLAPLCPNNTAGQLPEVGLNVFVEMTYTVCFAGYKTSLRQAVS